MVQTIWLAGFKGSHVSLAWLIWLAALESTFWLGWGCVEVSVKIVLINSLTRDGKQRNLKDFWRCLPKLLSKEWNCWREKRNIFVGCMFKVQEAGEIFFLHRKCCFSLLQNRSRGDLFSSYSVKGDLCNLATLISHVLNEQHHGGDTICWWSHKKREFVA